MHSTSLCPMRDATCAELYMLSLLHEVLDQNTMIQSRIESIEKCLWMQGPTNSTRQRGGRGRLRKKLEQLAESAFANVNISQEERCELMPQVLEALPEGRHAPEFLQEVLRSRRSQQAHGNSDAACSSEATQGAPRTPGHRMRVSKTFIEVGPPSDEAKPRHGSAPGRVQADDHTHSPELETPTLQMPGSWQQ